MPIGHTIEHVLTHRLRYPNSVRISFFFLLSLLLSLLLPSGTDRASSAYKRTLDQSSRRVLSVKASEQNVVSNETRQVREVAIGQQKVTPTPTQSPSEVWGVSKQVDEHTWTITVGKDEKSATAGEIHEALNAYRQKKGVSGLSWDDKLAAFAQSRADYFVTNGKLDSHAGFQDYINNQDGFAKLGFNGLGENSSLGFTLEGVHLIEWVYAGDKPHDDNQLNPSWTHVGVGVTGTATDLIFGGKKR